MVSNLINTREDLDAIAGTPAHQEAMAMLRGTLWRLEKDDAAKTWRAVEDDSIIARFGLTRADFPGAMVPAIPIYVPPAPASISVTPRQIRQALTAAGLRTQVEAAVAASSQDLKDWWEFSTSVDRNHPEVIAMGEALGVSVAALDALFVTAGGL